MRVNNCCSNTIYCPTTCKNPGPETIADKICKKLGIDRIIHPAVGVLGDISYIRRNSLMLLYHKPDLVVGFAHTLDESTVVRDMIQRADKMGYKSKVIDYKSLSR